MARTNNLSNFLTDVAGAIREKTGGSSTIPASEFDTEIRSITTAGNYQIKNLNISQNGSTIVTPDTGYDAIEELNLSVTVNPNLQNKTITQNGSYSADQGYDGLGTVLVNVPSQQINNQNKTITQNGSYTADSGYTGLGTVLVNVPSGIKRFATEQEMQADPNPTIGDLAVVYDDPIMPVTEDTETITAVSIPSVVTFDNAISDWHSMSFRNYDVYADFYVMVSPEEARISYYSDDHIEIEYTTEDSITYTKVSGPTEIEFPAPLKNGYGGYDEYAAKFILSKANVFTGLYQYDNWPQENTSCGYQPDFEPHNSAYITLAQHNAMAEALRPLVLTDFSNGIGQCKLFISPDGTKATIFGCDYNNNQSWLISDDAIVYDNTWYITASNKTPYIYEYTFSTQTWVKLNTVPTDTIQCDWDYSSARTFYKMDGYLLNFYPNEFTHSTEVCYGGSALIGSSDYHYKNLSIAKHTIQQYEYAKTQYNGTSDDVGPGKKVYSKTGEIVGNTNIYSNIPIGTFTDIYVQNNLTETIQTSSAFANNKSVYLLSTRNNPSIQMFSFVEINKQLDTQHLPINYDAVLGYGLDPVTTTISTGQTFNFTTNRTLTPWYKNDGDLGGYYAYELKDTNSGVANYFVGVAFDTNFNVLLYVNNPDTSIAMSGGTGQSKVGYDYVNNIFIRSGNFSRVNRKVLVFKYNGSTVTKREYTTTFYVYYLAGITGNGKYISWSDGNSPWLKSVVYDSDNDTFTAYSDIPHYGGANSFGNTYLVGDNGSYGGNGRVYYLYNPATRDVIDNVYPYFTRLETSTHLYYLGSWQQADTTGYKKINKSTKQYEMITDMQAVAIVNNKPILIKNGEGYYEHNDEFVGLFRPLENTNAPTAFVDNNVTGYDTYTVSADGNITKQRTGTEVIVCNTNPTLPVTGVLGWAILNSSSATATKLNPSTMAYKDVRLLTK